MNYAYIGKEYHGDNFRNNIIGADSTLKRWLELIIFREEPYLAENLKITNPDEEMEILLKMCKFFSAVLRDENPEPLPMGEFSLEFIGKHHNLFGTYLNFIRKIYRQTQPTIQISDK